MVVQLAGFKHSEKSETETEKVPIFLQVRVAD